MRRFSYRDLLGMAAVVACGLAAAATSPFRIVHPRSYPAWQILEGSRAEDGVSLRLWVSKSGKSGIGLTLLAERCGAEPPPVQVLRASLQVEGKQFPAKEAKEVAEPKPPGTSGPAEPPPPAGYRRYIYIPIPFDNERLWNSEQHRGEVMLELKLGEKQLSWRSGAVHYRRNYHRSVSLGGQPCDRLKFACGTDAGPAALPAPADAGVVLQRSADSAPDGQGGDQ